MEAARFEVYGRVQGVGYRYFAVRAARDLKLCGWVRNREDGTVEVAAQGSSEALEQLERKLGLAPPPAQVDRVTRSSWPAVAKLTGFEIVEGEQ